MSLALVSVFSSSSPAVHIAPEVMFKIAGVPITNSILYGWIGTIAMLVLFIWVAHRITVKPKGGIIQFIEVIAEFIGGTVEDAFDEKARSAKYVLYFVPLFFFILFNNLIGLIPGVGESLTYGNTALLRPLTADFNATLAMAVITMALVYVSSIRELGLKSYFSHFFVGSLKNPFYIFLGVIEMITDITRVVSLSLRLFLNISIVEIIVVVFAWLGHVLAPITATPFFLLDLFDDLLQAFIFVLLGAMYLAIAVNHGSAHEGHNLTSDALPEKIGAKA